MPTDPNPTADTAPNGESRDTLSRLVVVASFLTIGTLVVAMVVVGSFGTAGQLELLDRAFNVLVPVLAAWVGTVLTFYFSNQSQERLKNALTATRKPAESMPVGSRMIHFGKIRGKLDLTQPDTLKKTIEAFRKDFDTNNASRVLLHENGVFKYIVHRSVVDNFIAEKVLAATGATPAGLTLADLIEHYRGDTSKFRLDAAVFTPLTTPLWEAKELLASTQGVEDILITDTGAKDGTILGWLTDVDLFAALKA